MFCTNCGSKMSDDAKFCSKCGFKVQIQTEYESERVTDEDIDDEFSDDQKINAFFEEQKSNFQTRTINPTVKKATRPYIVKTIIVGNDSRKSATSSIVRGAIGGALLGPVGLLGGAISGKNKKESTFLLIYSNGRKKTVTVKTNSFLFKYYAKYLEY